MTIILFLTQEKQRIWMVQWSRTIFQLSLWEWIQVHNLHGLQKTERVQKGSRKSGESKVVGFVGFFNSLSKYFS